MAYFQTKKVKTIPLPIPDEPGYIPPSPPTPPAAEDGDAPEIIRPGLTSNSTITLYQVTDENEKVDKTLGGTPVVLQGAFVEDTDILNPTVEIESQVDLTQYNYAYINTTHRYYYMHVVLIPTNRFRLVMNIDVLKSYASGIGNCYGILSSTEDSNYYDDDLNDGSYLYDCGNAIKLDVYANGFLEEPANILITVGKGH